MARVDYVLDTNVLVHANGNKSEQTSLECKAKCVEMLFQIVTHSHRVVIDGGVEKVTSLILAEYENNIPVNNPGFGTNFLIWLLTNRMNDEHVVRVPITPQDESFEEFPKDKSLKKFDPRDRKWIATARAHHMYNETQAKIVQSADSKWYTEGFSVIFSELPEYPVEIEFICDEKK